MENEPSKIEQYKNLVYKLKKLQSLSRERQEVEGRPFIQTFKASNLKRDCQFLWLKDLRKYNFQGPLNGKYPYCTHIDHKDEYVKGSSRLISCHDCPHYRKAKNR